MVVLVVTQKIPGDLKLSRWSPPEVSGRTDLRSCELLFVGVGRTAGKGWRDGTE
jgi:hypothetical protein